MRSQSVAKENKNKEKKEMMMLKKNNPVLRNLVALAVMLAMGLATAAPAMAQGAAGTVSGDLAANAQQGPVMATGVLVGPVEDGDEDPTPKYTLSDEATGTNYVLISGFVELEPFAGQRVTITGVSIGGADNAPPALNVTQIEPAKEEDPPTSPSEKATLSFELEVEGEPPADAEFLGLTATESLMTTPLTDPDGDGTYTGSKTINKFAPGGPPEPISISPVQIVQGPPTGATANGPQYRVIKDFGSVKLDEDKTLSASVSFNDEEPDPEEVSATGRIVEIADYPGASHAIMDEASGVRYFLTSDSVDLQDYAASGERVIVYGTPVPNQSTTDTILNVTRIEPADGSGEEVSATGNLEQLEAEPVVVDGTEICELSTHATTDEATGQYYDLKSDAVDLDAYVGQRVTVYGESLASPDIGGAGAELCPDLEVTRIESAGTPPPDDGGSDNGGSNNGGGIVTSGLRNFLPSTGGGMALTLLGAGVLMTGGGLIIRRIFR